MITVRPTTTELAQKLAASSGRRIKGSPMRSEMAAHASALHACGAIAYRGDTEVSRCYRYAIAAPIMAPSQDWCNIFIGRALLEEPLFG